jgi:hypothetical protein
MVIGRLANKKFRLNPLDLAALSPYLTSHIKRFSDYRVIATRKHEAT